MRYVTHSPQETRKLGAQLAKKIVRRPTQGKRALVIGLEGDLGSGKTTFIQGFARGLGIRKRMVSPTFVIMRRHKIPPQKALKRTGSSRYSLPPTPYSSLIHIDCYRVHKPEELNVIHFDKWLVDPMAIVLIEWANLIEKKFLRGAHCVTFKHRKEGAREIFL